MELNNLSIEHGMIQMVNQVFEMERKLSKIDTSSGPQRGLQRSLRRMKQTLQDLGYSYHDPIGESYDETRTDCDASISGVETENLVIKEVIKPIIREGGNFGRIVQQGIVIVAGQE